MSIPCLNINEDDIKSTIEYCDSILREFNIDLDQWDENLTDNLEETGNWKDITASVQNAYMQTTIAFLKDKYPDETFDYEINGYISKIFVNGEEYNKGDSYGKFIKDFSITTDLDIVELSYNDIQKLDDMFRNKLINHIPLKYRHDHCIDIDNWKWFAEDAANAECEADLDDAYAAFCDEEASCVVYSITNPYDNDFRLTITLTDLLENITDLDASDTTEKIVSNILSCILKT